MSESIARRINALANSSDGKEMRFILDTILTDLTALRASITGITAQLDADAGVTDTDYAANNDPAALTTTS